MISVVYSEQDFLMKSGLHGDKRIRLNSEDLTIFFILDNLQDLVEYVNIIPSVQSDHSALKLKLSLLNKREREVSHIGNSIIHQLLTIFLSV